MPTAISSYGAEISFSPKWWSYVSSTRIMVSSFCNVALANEDIADKIAMTAQELLENAVKYSADAEHNVSLRFSIEADDQITHELSLDDQFDLSEQLDYFTFDPEYVPLIPTSYLSPFT